MATDGRTDPPDDFRAFVSALVREYRAARTRTTLALVALTSVVFLLQVAGAYLTGAPSVRALTAFLFLTGDDAVYLLSLFLHRGAPHFLSNALVLVVLAPQERHFSPRGYWLFVVTGALLTLGVGYAVLLAYSPESRVAFYGISGLGYALGGFALVRGLRHRRDCSPLDVVAAIVGLSSVVEVAGNLFVSLPGAPAGVNGGHLSGLAFGLAVGAMWRGRRDLSADEERGRPSADEEPSRPSSEGE
ncbi:rhomboid family intramembrane serine protease [Halobaculum sp. CBA1158]|uniref:rhomboid family intramembrane serine protease n=1 Tax=Halobaculum sp. CBA1158 TaxID=2904243 RepID=UPI001F20F759|nr:rhomboid family intramembrane serine protease [Halobaculum sp. CBA1158]UIP00670.1 rhomboid family intramembrane serine protease [Halobaculum sp. CBA1158]